LRCRGSGPSYIRSLIVYKAPHDGVEHKGPGDRRRGSRLGGAGEGLTTAIRKAAEERLQRVRRVGGKTVLEDIMAIAAHCAALPDLDTRTADEIMGYDEFGLPA
jgi:antitoxin VapB